MMIVWAMLTVAAALAIAGSWALLRAERRIQNAARLETKKARGRGHCRGPV